MVFLPLACLVVITLAIYRSSLKHGLRESFLFSSVIICFFIFISCESLSIFQAISLPVLFNFWVVILFSSAFILFRQPPRHWAAPPSFTFFDKCMCLAIGLVIVATGLNAAISAVTNYDSLAYHMARVAHWVNGVSWLSMVGSCIGVSLIAKEFKARPRGEILAALMTVTIPIGIAQAVSTKNDYVLTFMMAVC